MSTNTTIARPYAKAAFEYAVEADVVSSWNEWFERLAKIVSVQQVQDLLKNPQVDAEQKLQFIVDLSSDDITTEQKNFLKMLNRYERLLIIPELADLFEVYAKNHAEMVEVNVTTAHALRDTQIQNLQKALQIRLGKRVAIVVHEDDSLIGGIIIKANDFVIDGSVRGKLRRMRKTLTR